MAAAKPAKKTPRATKKQLSEADLVEIGTRFSAESLTEHWATVRPKIKAAAARFAKFKFDADRLKAIDGLAADLVGVQKDKSKKGAERISTGTALGKALARAKSWRRDAHTYLANARQPASDASASTPRRLVAAIDRLLPLLDSDAVKAEGGDADFVSEGAAARDGLHAAIDAHAGALGALSPDARAVHAKKGELYDLLKKAARVARNVVPSEAHLFSLSRLHAATPSRAKKAAPPAPDAKK